MGLQSDAVCSVSDVPGLYPWGVPPPGCLCIVIKIKGLREGVRHKSAQPIGHTRVSLSLGQEISFVRPYNSLKLKPLPKLAFLGACIIFARPVPG